MTKIKAGNFYICLKDISGYDSFTKGMVYSSIYDNALINDNHIEVKVMNSEYFRIASDKEIFKANLDRLKEETYIGLSEHDNGVETGRMEVINALYRLLDSMQEEPKKCIYTKDNYTDEDRKVLCDGCEEECEYAQKEEPVSEDLEEAAKHYLYSNILYDDVYVGNPTDKDCIEMFKAGANWQKQQMMKDAITGQLENGEDYLRIKCLYTSCRPQDDGKLVKFIIIKED